MLLHWSIRRQPERIHGPFAFGKDSVGTGLHPIILAGMYEDLGRFV